MHNLVRYERATPEGKLHRPEIASGTIKNFGTWSLSSSGLLTIDGQGEMPHWPLWLGESWFPWREVRKHIRSVRIALGITSIAAWTFCDCSSLHSIHLPYSVTTIGEYAFHSCSSLSSITIPDGVTSIGSSAFSGCSSLKTISVPAGLDLFGYRERPFFEPAEFFDGG